MTHGRTISRLPYSNYIETFTLDGSLLQGVPGVIGCGLLLGRSEPARLAARLDSKQCPYCAEDLVLAHREGEVSPFQTFLGIEHAVITCDVCGFWKIYKRTPEDWVWLSPSVASFQPTEQTPALSALIEQVKRNPDKVYEMDPTRFEVFVGSVLKDFFNCEVRHVGQSGDGGIDLVLVDMENPLMVQVKRRTRRGSVEGIEIVKNLFASLFAARSRHGMVVTTAQRFTRGAHEWIRDPALEESAYKMELVDINRLMDMVCSVEAPSELPWERALAISKKVSPIKDQRNWGHEHLTDGLWLYLDQDSTDDALLFSAADRDVCWQVSRPAYLSGDVRQLIEAACSNGYAVEQISGLDFADRLADLPLGAKKLLVDLWAGRDGELLVEYEL